MKTIEMTPEEAQFFMALLEQLSFKVDALEQMKLAASLAAKLRQEPS
jgi:hypothetical protein